MTARERGPIFVSSTYRRQKKNGKRFLTKICHVRPALGPRPARLLRPGILRPLKRPTIPTELPPGGLSRTLCLRRGCSPGFTLPPPSSRSTLASSLQSTRIHPIQSTMATVRVFFDVTADGAPLGKVIMEVSVQVLVEEAARAKYKWSRQADVHVTGKRHGG